MIEGERCLVGKPAGERLGGVLLVARRDIEECRGTRAAIQIFVAAADGEIRIGDGEIDWNGPRGMGEIPQRQRACLMGGGGHRFHVVHVAGAVVHMGQHQHGNLVREGAGQLGRVFDQTEFMTAAKQRRQAFRHIKIGSTSPKQ